MRSLYSGVAGLKTHQTKMDVIGNNVANVNTTAYKSQSVSFSDVMYQTTSYASGANAATGTGGVNAMQIGLGVSTGAIATAISTSGSAQTTSNPFDIMVNGDAFFVVSNGSDTFFTRDGSFYVDGVGNLCMRSNGYTVMGWQVDEATMSIKQDSVSSLQVMNADNMTYPPEATSLAYVSGILDKNDTNVTSTSGKTISLGFYDSLGYAYTAKMSIHQTELKGEYYMQLDDIIDSNGTSLKDIYGTDDITSIAKIGGKINVAVADTYNFSDNVSVTYKQMKYDVADNSISWKKGDGTDAADMTEAVYGVIESTGNFVDKSGLVFKTKDAAISSNDAAPNDAVAQAALNDFRIYTTNVDTVSLDNGVTTYTLGELQSLFENGTLNIEDFYAGIDADKINDYSISDTGVLTVSNKEVDGAKLVYNNDDGAFISINGGKEVTFDFAENINGTTLQNFSDIAIDFSSSTMFNNSGTSTIGATSGDKTGLGTGRKLGEMSGISISNNGMIYASYDNGQTKLLGQIAVASFANASGLSKQGDNLYSATLNSGEFDGIGEDVTAGGGSLSTGVLEMSNVDLAAEFTEMITTQRGYQANSRIITTSDTMLEELVNLKR